MTSQHPGRGDNPNHSTPKRFAFAKRFASIEYLTCCQCILPLGSSCLVGCVSFSSFVICGDRTGDSSDVFLRKQHYFVFSFSGQQNKECFLHFFCVYERQIQKTGPNWLFRAICSCFQHRDTLVLGQPVSSFNKKAHQRTESTPNVFGTRNLQIKWWGVSLLS